MTSGDKVPSLERSVRACWLVALLAAQSPVFGDTATRAWNLGALLGSLATRQQGTARFTEIRNLKVLTKPLRSSGMLSFHKPDVLEKRVTSPQPELLRVEGDRVTIDDGSPQSPRILQLSEHPEVAILIEAIRTPLTGNLDRLHALFQVSLGGSERRWLLSLVPRDPRAAEWVRSVYVRGSGDRVNAVEIEERSGDRTVLHIEPMP